MFNRKIEYNIISNNKLCDIVSGCTTDILAEEGNRFYATILKSGHCGIEYFIPVIKSAKAKDLETAIKFLKNTPKIKRSISCVIDSCEILEPAHKLIFEINKHDRYITSYKDDESVLEEIDRRKILLENHNEVAWKDKKKRTRDVKVASDYDEDCIVERYCAPYYIGDRLIYPSKVDMRGLLDDFFENRVRRLGIDGNCVELVWLYYSLYGKNNRLGVSYENGTIIYSNKYNQTVEVRLSSKARKYVETGEYTRARRELNTKVQEGQGIEPESRLIEKRISRTDRFNARFAKTQEIKSKIENSTEEKTLKID